jgi:hypothetical protein
LLLPTAPNVESEAVEEDLVAILGGKGVLEGGLEGEVAVISGPRRGGALRKSL